MRGCAAFCGWCVTYGRILVASRRGVDRLAVVDEPSAFYAGDCPQPHYYRRVTGMWQGVRCKKRTCPSCGKLWAGDSKNRLLVNLIEGYGGEAVLLTITAPGAEVLPWDGDQVERQAARAWNLAAPKQWSAMHRRLAVALARRGLKPNLLAYAWAFQKRGVLHLHLALGAQTPGEAYAAKVYGQLLKGDREGSDALRVVGKDGPVDLERGWAKEWGFGFVDVQPMRRGAKGLARYLARYLCKDGVSGRPELAETVDHPDVPARPIYISLRLTATTRCTMRNLRLRRYYWRAWTCRQTGLLTCDYAEDLAARGMKVLGGRLLRPLSEPRRGP